jgi:hypothetical protein
MALGIGSRLGPYEIQAAIGAGGMGEVYRARDTRLHRDVAVKVLPDAFAADPDRLARFEREAQLLASLNHPNIAAIHGLEESGGARALVLEFVDGPTLADRLAEGPLPIDEALRTARQIAGALEAAHDIGIVHRDLKPANIKLRSDGTVKVLDFGLAKALEHAPASAPSLAPTVTSPAMVTGAGVILGTAAYMSPEQARGRPVDKRTDIWAFGCVLYEMLTGRRAFDGPEVTDVLARILEREPDFTALPSQAPEAIQRLLRRCLQKDRSERLRDVADARMEIDEARATGGTPAMPARPPSPIAAVRWGAAGFAVIIAVATGWYLALRQPPAGAQVPAAHVQIALPPGVHVAVETEHPALALSPDGFQIVFVGDDGSRRQLYVRELAAPEVRILPGTAGAASPFYSPDGAWIGLFQGGLLKKVSPAGGVPVAAHASTGTTVNRGATWIANDSIVFAQSPNSGLSLGSVADERLHGIQEWTWITDNTLPYAWPHALPGGDYVLFTDNSGGSLDDARVAILSLSTKEVRTVVNGGTNPRYSPTGHVLFVRSRGLYSVPFNLQRGEPTGPERLLLRDLITGPNGAAQFTVAASGTLAYVAGSATPAEDELVWIDRTGNVQTVLDDGRTYEDPRLSPDGGRLAFTHR